jgi:hypothetical protein
MLLTGAVAGLASVLAWPFLYIIFNMQVLWFRLCSRKCETEIQRKLSRKVYNIQAAGSFFLGLFEAGASLALSGAKDQRLGGVLAFTVYFYVPYALLTIWGMGCLDRLLLSIAVRTRVQREANDVAR